MEATTARGYGRAESLPRRLVTETKQAFKTTEFWAYLVVLIGLFIAGALVDGSSTDATATTPAAAAAAAQNDGFAADEVWLYAVILTVGYMVARGIAKAGSRDPYWHQPSDGSDESIVDRAKAAAAVLKEGEGARTENTTTGHGTGQRY